MKLHYYKPPDGTSNFGDELNAHIWEHYFPGFFDGDVSEVFFGIGTILRAAKKLYPDSKIIVFGSGAHGETQKMEPNFIVEFVRGPLSAKAMGLDDSQWITDPAILIPEVFKKKNGAVKFPVSYMPHFSVANPTYKKLCDELQIHYIDPRNPVEIIIESINSSDLLLTEAMHGAIVADAYRVPWLPIQSYASFNHFKWNDWAKSLGMEIKVHKIPRFYENEKGLKFKIKKSVAQHQLKTLYKKPGILSSEETSQKATARIKERIANFIEVQNDKNS